MTVTIIEMERDTSNDGALIPHSQHPGFARDNLIAVLGLIAGIAAITWALT